MENNKQQIIENIIKNDIYVCQSSLVDKLLADEILISYEDISNQYTEDEEFKEVYEWYSISEYLKERLLEVWAVVIDSNYGIRWGRTETGQSLTMDNDLSLVADEILK